MKKLIKKIPGFKVLDTYLRKRYTGLPGGERYPRGHYYSPLPDISEITSMEEGCFLKNGISCLGIDMQDNKQLTLLKKLSTYYESFNYSEKSIPLHRFHLGQEWFCHGDALILFCMMRHLRPKTVIEAGSGFSSALMLDTDQAFNEMQAKFIFIDPYPARLHSLLLPDDLSRCEIIQDKLQNINIALFQDLQANDILFIDSSHVSKFASDVNFLLFEIIPILKIGVIIHFHDVIWPFEYPIDWIIKGRAWNEAYLLRAFLQYNKNFEILMFNSYIGYVYREFLKVEMPLFLKNTGGSLWIRKVLD